MKVKKYNNQAIILKVFCYTPISKPLNGAIPRSNNSHLLRLSPIVYTYKSGKEKKSGNTETYFIKGLRGALRHQVMQICFDYGLYVCHTSDKETDKHGNFLLPDGFHLLGSCQTNGECIIHQVFGSKGNEGLISVYADPITSLSHKTAVLLEKVQDVHISTENRTARSFDGRSIQDFGERYFSGDFAFEIDVSNCNEVQLGMIIDAVMKLHKLGRGFNSGYGRIHIKRFKLLKRHMRVFPEWKDDSFIVKEEINEVPMKEEVIGALKVWYNFIKEEVSIKCN